eukprot:7537912-Alexandrium_andersonii.AAC.1
MLPPHAAAASRAPAAARWATVFRSRGGASQATVRSLTARRCVALSKMECRAGRRRWRSTPNSAPRAGSPRGPCPAPW